MAVGKKGRERWRKKWQLTHVTNKFTATKGQQRRLLPRRVMRACTLRLTSEETEGVSEVWSVAPSTKWFYA